MKTIRVLLADDHVLIRAGVRNLLEKMQSVEVVAEAGDGREAVELVRKYVPNIAVMDIAMPGLNGLEAIARTCNEFPTVKVLVLSMHNNEEYVVEALRAGAKGYMLKDAAVEELENAIKALIADETYLSPSISKHVLEKYMERVGNHHAGRRQLTPRQREIVQLVAEGKSTKEIAFLLKLSTKTVDAHRMQLMNKLRIHNVPALVRFAMRAGIVPPETLPE